MLSYDFDILHRYARSASVVLLIINFVTISPKFGEWISRQQTLKMLLQILLSITVQNHKN